MRVFAISDLHINYDENRRWFYNLSQSDYKDDILILAGDITDSMPSLERAFGALKRRFGEVFYVPGNHELWISRDSGIDSLEKANIIKSLAGYFGIRTEPAHFGRLSVVPLLGWYDYSFGLPSTDISCVWADYRACKWPDSYDEKAITKHFTAINEAFLNIRNSIIISFSHFLPRIDVMPSYIPESKKYLYPVLGSYLIEAQIRRLGSDIHIYGHSHVNTNVVKDNTLYINNAFGYPYECLITSKELLCIFEL